MCVCPHILDLAVNYALKNRLGAGHDDLYLEAKNLNTIVTSFWGFEQPHHTPPNIVLTGPLLADSSDYLERLHAKSPDLGQWLDNAQASGDPVMYITFGSECIWF